MLRISSNAKLFCSNAILITGSARSGTSLVGSIIHSFENVEYAYEPQLLVALLPLINNMNASHWKLLYETYLYEDFFLNAIAGRSINCNKVDYSSIYKTKSARDVKKRLSTHFNKLKTHEFSAGKVIAYKIPNVVNIVPKIKAYYPSLRVIIVLRNANHTIYSLLNKKWFSRGNDNTDIIWPFKIHANVRVPYWVNNGDEELWVEMSELDRAAYYYIRMNENINKISDRIEVKYLDVVRAPKQEVERIAASLNLNFGEKTMEIIGNIVPTGSLRDEDILKGIREDFRNSINLFSEISI